MIKTAGYPLAFVAGLVVLGSGELWALAGWAMYPSFLGMCLDMSLAGEEETDTR